MATRSSITVKLPNGKYRGIYAHWDGYPSHNGVILLKYYNSQERAEALTAIGDLSSLRPTIDNPPGHSFDSPAEGCTVFYGRDRGDEDTGPTTDFTHAAVLKRVGNEYNYLFEDGQWYVKSYRKKLTLLSNYVTADMMDAL